LKKKQLAKNIEELPTLPSSVESEQSSSIARPLQPPLPIYTPISLPMLAPITNALMHNDWNLDRVIEVTYASKYPSGVYYNPEVNYIANPPPSFASKRKYEAISQHFKEVDGNKKKAPLQSAYPGVGRLPSSLQQSLLEYLPNTVSPPSATRAQEGSLPDIPNQDPFHLNDVFNQFYPDPIYDSQPKEVMGFVLNLWIAINVSELY
jgi:hypothetical protein